MRGDFLLDHPDVAYLDHGAFGATPAPSWSDNSS
jgi:hypothetical protein